MPELPEVETIRLQLKKYLVGHTIKKVDIKYSKIISGDIKKIEGGRVSDIRRFGKVTVIDLNNNYSILIHVKLTGQLIYKGPNLKSDTLSKKVIGGLGGPHTLLTFELDKEGKLYYNDVRRFGWIKIEKTDGVEKESFISKLGPEPFKTLTEKYFVNLLSKSKGNTKTLSMDQTKISGVGNIYANDALWLSKINPKKKSNSLSDREKKELFKSIHIVLKSGLKYQGASELAFVTPDGGEGKYQEHTLVYGREKSPCKRCKEKIRKEFLGGRGTYFCPNCQA